MQGEYSGLTANKLIASLSRADEILETINIEIDISWNSTSVNTSAQAPVNSAETPSSTDFNATPGRAMAAVLSSRSGGQIGPTPAITQSSEAGPFVGTQMDSSMPTGSSWPGYRGLTGSAPTASQSSGLKQSNSSLWATGSLRPTAQASPSPFSGKASARKVSKEDVDLLIVLGCVIGIFL